jgi:hypothetical protein
MIEPRAICFYLLFEGRQPTNRQRLVDGQRQRRIGRLLAQTPRQMIQKSERCVGNNDAAARSTRAICSTDNDNGRIIETGPI